MRSRPPLPPCAHLVINLDGMCENCGEPTAAGARAAAEALTEVNVPAVAVVEKRSLGEAPTCEQHGTMVADDEFGMNWHCAVPTCNAGTPLEGCDLTPAEPVDIPEVPEAPEAPEVDSATAALVDTDADVEASQGPPDEPQYQYIAGTAGCLSGDTVVDYHRGARQGSRQIALKDFYRKFNGLWTTSPPAWDLSLPTFLHSLGDDGVMFYNRVVAVYESGTKAVVRLEVEGEQGIRATPDHPFMTPNGYVQAGNLQVGQTVLARGTMLAQTNGGRDLSGRPPRAIICTKYHPYGSYKNVSGYEYMRVARARLVVEAYLNDIPYSELVHILKHNEEAAGQLRYVPTDFEVHHLDEDTLNDELGNLVVLSKAEHARLHNQKGNFRFDSYRELKVLKVESFGEEMTYDIQMEAPANNFCANGIVVHNTGKSYQARKRAHDWPDAVLTASTGIAAVNLGGTTINSVLGYFDTGDLQTNYELGRLNQRLRQLAGSGYTRLIVDECFDYKQPVLTETGWMRIGDIVKRRLQIKVAAVDPMTNRIEWRPIVNWLRKRHTGTTLLRVDIGRNGSRRGARVIKCTPNHPVAVPNGYVPAGTLRVGDSVFVRGATLSDLQRSMIVGSLLGDASLSYKKHNRNSPQIVLMNGAAQEDYLRCKQRILGTLAGKWTSGASGYKPGNIVYRLPVNVVDEFYDMANERVVHGKYWSPLPAFIRRIDTAALAFWFCDDGSVGRNKKGGITGAAIHLPPFNALARTRLVNHLNEHFGFRVKTTKTGRGHWRIVFGVVDALRLVELIKDFVPPCMKYKVPEARADYTGTHQRHMDVCLAKVRSIAEVPMHRESTHVFDLEVEEHHNYIAGSVLVHNCSMMDGRQLDILCLAFDEVNEWLAKEGKPVLGLTLVGDFAQLPPVKAPYVFQQPSWDRFEGNTILLTEPRRQADPEFVRALQCVRRGDRQAATAYFAKYISPNEDRTFDGTTILAKNDEVERYNKIRMLQLPGAPEYYTSERSGEQSAEWKHIPTQLELKPGCLVMILANRFEEGGGAHRELLYANGDLAHYIGRAIPGNDPKSPAMVKLIRNGETHMVTRVEREKAKPTGNKGKKAPRSEKLGWIEYLPLRVAYGSTVHKSQGLSLDRVQLMINSQFWMQSGMLYVALSRCRTPQGLKIVGSVKQFEARVRANPLIQRWL